MSSKDPAAKVVRDIRRKTRRKHSTEEKIRIVLEGLRGEETIAALCRREGIAESLYYSWSKASSTRNPLTWSISRSPATSADFPSFAPVTRSTFRARSRATGCSSWLP